MNEAKIGEIIQDAKIGTTPLNLFKKSLIVLAGPVANFIFAILIFASFYMHYGRFVVSPEISFVEKGTVFNGSN